MIHDDLSTADEPFWASIRELFSLDPAYAHLVGFWLSSHPKPVQARIDVLRAEFDRNPYLFLRDNEAVYEDAVRRALAQFLDCESPAEIAVVESTSVGLGLVLAGISLQHEDEILSTQHEHYSAWTAADLLAARAGAKVTRVSLYDSADDTSADDIVRRLVDNVTARTRAIVLTWVHSSTGVRLPLEALCAGVRSCSRSEGATPLIIVDATHAVGAIPVSVKSCGADVVVGACHKWMLGPRGTAFAWVRSTIADRIHTVIPSFAPAALGQFTGAASQGTLSPGERLSPGGFHCFEHRWAIPASTDVLQSIGTDRLFARIRRLTVRLNRQLRDVPGVDVLSPSAPDLTAGFVCFNVAARQPEEVTRSLRLRGVLCAPSPYRRSSCRFSPFIYNSASDVVRAVEAVTAVADGHSVHPRDEHSPPA